MRDEAQQHRVDQLDEHIPLSYYNAEHYADPTTYHALRNIERDRQMKRSSADVAVKKKVRTQVVWYD